MRLTHAYSELLERVQSTDTTKKKKKPQKTADDIAADIIKRHGLVISSEGVTNERL